MKTISEEALPDLLLTAHEVADILSIGLRTVWRWSSSGRLPKPINVAGTATRWKASEIQEFINKQERKN